MKVFVTGGTGFIGSHFLNKATSAGHEVKALRRSGSNPRIRLETEPSWLVGDLESVEASDFEGCDALVHLASYGVDPQYNDWDEIYRWNVTASLGVWRKAIAAGVKRFVICGSCFEYGRSGEEQDFLTVDTVLKPVTPYAASKAAASMLAIGLSATENVEVIIARPFHVYGEGESEYRLWPSLRKAAHDGANFDMTLGEQIRDFVSVDTVAERLLIALDEKVETSKACIVNIGSGKPQTIAEFSQKWWRHWNATGELKVGALPYRKNEVMKFVPKTES